MALRTTLDSRRFKTYNGAKGFKVIVEDDKVEILPARKPKQFTDMPNPY